MTCQIIDYVEGHKATVLFVAATVGSAAISTMPDPSPTSRWYRWAFDFLHQLINSRKVPTGPKV